MDLSQTDILELVDRYNYLLKQYVEMTVELADKLEKFGRVRKEIQLIVVELDQRKQDVKEPEELKKMLEQIESRLKEDMDKELK
jgi:enoyl reductase-like protein